MSFLQSDTASDITRDPVNLAKLVRENPVMVAQHFVKRWRSLFKQVILNGKGGALGKVTDYFVRVEFQNRGSPHLHIFLVDKRCSQPCISRREKAVSTINRSVCVITNSKQNKRHCLEHLSYNSANSSPYRNLSKG